MKFIITGGGTGIGRALAINLATIHQKQVVIVGRHAATLEETRSICPSHINILQADITTEIGIAVIADTLKNTGPGNYLVNNAGIADPLPLSSISEINIQTHLNVNFIAPTLLTQKLLPQLENGRVLFISTGLAHNAGSGMFSYGASKAALYNGWKYWKAEHPEIAFGIVQPGMVDTPIQTYLRNSSHDKLPIRDYFTDTYRKNQLLKPPVVAKFLSWLLLNTTSEAFSAKEWSIYDKEHWSQWAGEGEVVVRDASRDIGSLRKTSD